MRRARSDHDAENRKQRDQPGRHRPRLSERSSANLEINLTTPKAVEAYTGIMRGCAVIIVDSLKACTPGADENSSSIRDLIKVLSRASEATGCTAILIHHMGHVGKDGAGRGRGSSAIFDEVATELRITKKDGDPLRLVEHKKDRSLGELHAPFAIRFVTPPDDLVVSPVGAARIAPRWCNFHGPMTQVGARLDLDGDRPAWETPLRAVSFTAERQAGGEVS
jgi:hypothetical protein